MYKVPVKESLDLYNSLVKLEKQLNNVKTKHPLHISPYIYTWGYKNTVYKVNTCTDAFKHGIKACNIAFVTGPSCDEIIKTIRDDVLNFNKLGGKVTVSFGGAAGLYMENLLTEELMVGQVSNLIALTGVKSLDFDVEGSYLADKFLNAKRDRIIVKLQAKYPDLKIMFTLPADRQGLNMLGLDLLKNSRCHIDVVNIMAMDIGAVDNWGVTSVEMCEKTARQLEKIFPQRQCIYPSLGVTTMIGRNDDGSTFKPEHAKALREYALEKELGFVSYWSLNRDQVGTGDLSIYSQTNTRDLEYFQAFNGN